VAFHTLFFCILQNGICCLLFTKLVSSGNSEVTDKMVFRVRCHFYLFKLIPHIFSFTFERQQVNINILSIVCPDLESNPILQLQSNRFEQHIPDLQVQKQVAVLGSRLFSANQNYAF